jgi:hypothetical protein
VPGLSQRDSRRPFQQWRPDGFLQLTDLLAEGRLRHAEPACRRGEAEFLGDGDKVAKVAEVYGGWHIENVSCLSENNIGDMDIGRLRCTS